MYQPHERTVIDPSPGGYVELERNRRVLPAFSNCHVSSDELDSLAVTPPRGFTVKTGMTKCLGNDFPVEVEHGTLTTAYAVGPRAAGKSSLNLLYVMFWCWC